MEDYRNRKKDQCTTYRREGRTKQNIYECLPSTVDWGGGGGGKSCQSGARTNQNIYECCPPTPVELRCSVCWTAEREGCNLWTCVPFVSYSVLCGPTLADFLVHLLNLLPLSFLACLGVAHPRCCSAKPSPPLIKCNPVATPCAPVSKGIPLCSDKRQAKKPCPCPMTNPEIERFNECGDSLRSSKTDTISAWMHDEYEALANELADIKRLTNEGDSRDVDNQRDLLQARNYVLDRLAEMLAKREEIEKRIKKKKQRR